MKKSNKKGFTIVELVIVIAVIAILAAVLIPTFSSLVKKANLSADKQAVREMNMALAADEAKNGKPADVIAALEVLTKAGYNVEKDYVALVEGYVFYWDSSENRVILYNDTDKKVEYPEDLAKKYSVYNEEYSMLWKVMNDATYVTVDGVTASNLEEKLKNATSFQTVKLTEDATLTTLPKSDSGKTSLDLGGHTIKFTNTVSTVNNSGESIYISNGKIEGPRINIFANTRVTLENVEYTATSTPFYVEGQRSEINVINCKVKINGGDGFVLSSNAGNVSHYGVAATIKDSTFVIEGTDCTGVLLNVPGRFTFENCTIEGGRQGVIVRAGTAVFKNCEIKCRGWVPDESNKAEYDPSYVNDKWGEGNRVITAGLVVGSKNGSYKTDAVCELINTKVSCENGQPTIYLAGSEYSDTITSFTYDSNCGISESDIQYFAGSNVIKGGIRVNGKVLVEAK